MTEFLTLLQIFKSLIVLVRESISIARPFHPIAAATEPSHFEVLEIRSITNATGQCVYPMNDSVAEADVTNLGLFLANEGVQNFRHYCRQECKFSADYIIICTM